MRQLFIPVHHGVVWPQHEILMVFLSWSTSGEPVMGEMTMHKNKVKSCLGGWKVIVEEFSRVEGV